jgi:demethylmenaquinone methyltransferase/2-methoxy-6-polyprenyl-1,4-benzoquinol methylase
MELDTFFDAASFDAVVSTLVFSELSGDEVDFALSECNRLLEPGGRLLIADEIMPETGVGKILSWLVRFPLALVAFALTQTSTRRVSDLGIRIERAGFWLARETRYLCGTLRLYEAQKAL